VTNVVTELARIKTCILFVRTFVCLPVDLCLPSGVPAQGYLCCAARLQILIMSIQGGCGYWLARSSAHRLSLFHFAATKPLRFGATRNLYHSNARIHGVSRYRVPEVIALAH